MRRTDTRSAGLPRHSLQRGAALAVALATAATVVAAAGTAVQRERLADAQGELRGTLRPAQRGVEALLRSYVDQETGQRGYLLTGDPQFLAPYQRGKTEAAAREAELRTLNPSPQYESLRNAAFAAANRWQVEVAEPEIALRRKGAIPSKELRETTRLGKLLFDDLRVRISELSAHLSALIAVQLDRFDTAQSWADRAAIATVVLMLLAVLLGLAALHFLLTRPLRRLLRRVRAVAEGNYAEPIEPAGPREVASIALAAEQLRLGMLRHSDEIALAQERLSVVAERDRLAANLQQGAIARVSGLGTSLFGLAGRYPEAQHDLLALSRESDAAVVSLREAVYALEPDRHAATSIADAFGPCALAAVVEPAVTHVEAGKG